MSNNYYDEPNYTRALKFLNKIIERDRRSEWERLNAGVLMQIKENYALRLANAAQYNDIQTKYFIEGFCGIPIKNSNPRSKDCVKEFKEGKKLSKIREAKDFIAQKKAALMKKDFIID